MELGTNPDWPQNGLGPVNFVLVDEYGFQINGSAQITRSGGTAVTNFPDDVAFFGNENSIAVVYDANAGNSGIGESTNTATLSFSSAGSPIGVDRIEFIISDIDAVDNNGATDRCDFVTASGNNGNPTLSYVSNNAASRSVQIGGSGVNGSGATGPLAANQAQCIYNTGATGSNRSQADDSGSVLAVWPAGTSTATVAYDESIENVLGQTNRNAAARGIGLWGGSIITVDQSISLVKTVDTSAYNGANETLNYTYTVTNDGPLPINTGQDVVIEDDVIGTVSCPTVTSDIPVGGTLVCIASYTTTAADASVANVTNTAVAGVGTPGQAFSDRLQSNNDQAIVIRETVSLSLEKTVQSITTVAGSSPTLTDAQDRIVFIYEVTNTGTGDLLNVSINDVGPTFDGDNGTGIFSPILPSSTNIPAGESATFSARYTLSQGDVDNAAGIVNAVRNTANASGISNSGTPAVSSDDTATATITGGPDLSVIKVADRDTNVPEGTLITYTYRVRNTGNQTLTNINLTDIHNGSGPTPIPSGESLSEDNGTSGDSTDTASDGVWDVLAPNDEVTFTATYTVTQQDINTLQ